jgi:hypothetical protein
MLHAAPPPPRPGAACATCARRTRHLVRGRCLRCRERAICQPLPRCWRCAGPVLTEAALDTYGAVHEATCLHCGQDQACRPTVEHPLAAVATMDPETAAALAAFRAAPIPA